MIDTSCTALLRLARSVHQHGYKVALTGEGSDEWLAGYPWFKVHRLLGMFDWLPAASSRATGCVGCSCGAGVPQGSVDFMDGVYENLGTYTAFQDIYGVMALSRLRFYTPETLHALKDYQPYLELEPDLERMKRWHPLNRVFWSGRIHLAGHLLSSKGDRVAMNSSVETRYPFLDEEVFNFLARIHPRWKMRGFKDKYLLRLLGERYLPHEVAWRPKGMFRCAARQLLRSPGSPLRRSAFERRIAEEDRLFQHRSGALWRDQVRNRQLRIYQKSAIELGLVAVVATQLWHHQFIDGSLADLASRAP